MSNSILPVPLTAADEDRFMRMTLLKQNTEPWQRARETFQVTASEVPACCGVGKYTRAHLWRYKMGYVTSLVDDSNDYIKRALEHGRVQEPNAVRRFERLMCVNTVATGIWAYPADTRIGASPDRLVVVGSTLVPLEIKCPVAGDYVPRVDRICCDAMQLQTHIQCVDAPYGFLFYFNAEQPDECTLIRLSRDDDYWNDFIYPLVCSFIHYRVCCLEPPRQSKARISADIDDVRTRQRAIMDAAAQPGCDKRDGRTGGSNGHTGAEPAAAADGEGQREADGHAPDQGAGTPAQAGGKS